jgi:competence protein ComEC
MLILNNDLPYSLPDFKPSHLLLRNNPKLNVDRLLEKYHPKMVISDGSNLPWNVKRWKDSCRKNKVLFYNTGEKGALKINL